MTWWNGNKEKFERIKNEYGRVALGTYLALWAAVLVAYAVAIKLGIDVDGVSSKGGILFGAWVAAKVSQPVRIVLTVVLTPFVASVLRRPPTPLAAPEE